MGVAVGDIAGPSRLGAVVSNSSSSQSTLQGFISYYFVLTCHRSAM
jgi:hypothetical protein